MARSLLMVWQAYLDESIDPESGVLVLAGYIATAESWSAFTRDWEDMLPHGVVGKDGIYRFKMSEMAMLPERMERVPGFYRVIEKHIPLGISMTMKLDDFDKGKARLVVFNEQGRPVPIRGDLFENIYLFTFLQVIKLFHQNRFNDDLREYIPIDEKVDFIFDERSEKKSILGSWEGFLNGNEYRDRYGATPRFENDDNVLPLQAADFFAWWTRKWHLEGRVDFARPFPWEARKVLPVITAKVTEDNVFEDFKNTALNLGKPRTVFDRNHLLRLQLSPSAEHLFRFSLSSDGIKFASAD